MNLQFNRFKPVLLFLALVAQCGLAAAQYQHEPIATPDSPEQSEKLKNSKDPDFILRNFRTMCVDASEAEFFGSELLKAELGRNDDFAKLNIRMVDDRRVADVGLKVSYTFAWDYPFELRHQNTPTLLISGKGQGPLSGPLCAFDVAHQFAHAVTKYCARDKKKCQH